MQQNVILTLRGSEARGGCRRRRNPLIRQISIPKSGKGRKGHTCYENASVILCQVWRASIRSINERRDSAGAVLYSMVSETSCEAGSTSNEEDDLFLCFSCGSIESSWNACDSEGVCLCRYFAHGRKNDVGMLAGHPCHASLESQTSRIRRKKLHLCDS